jgi:hypothetical protein
MFFESETVFVGTVTDKRLVDMDRDVNSIRYTIKVEEVFRGRANETEHVKTENSTGRWYAEVGETYLVFSTKRGVGGTCGPLDEPRYVPEAIRQIRDLRNASNATIEGEVVRNGAPGNPAPGVTVRILGDGAAFEAVTDQAGLFNVVLPPGRYTLDANELRPTDYSKQELRNIRLVRGQCAQFQLTTK